MYRKKEGKVLIALSALHAKKLKRDQLTESLTLKAQLRPKRIRKQIGYVNVVQKLMTSS